MSKSYDKLIKKALKESTDKGIISEGFGYPDNMTERMHPEIESAVKDRKTSIGDHPALPSGGVRPYDQKLILGRFMEVVNACKEAFDTNEISQNDLPEMASGVQNLLFGCMETERDNRSELEGLAEKLVREDYDVSEDLVEFNCKLVDGLTMERQLTRELQEEDFTLDFENADAIENAGGEVMKRRMINSMIQGGANKCNHMYHMGRKDLTDIDPTLLNKYKKLMAFNDYMYFMTPETGSAKPAGVVNVDFNEQGKPVINAEALTFPVLIHEMVKGVLELVSMNGFTDDEPLNEYVTKHADFLAAEPWDLRIGPAIWDKVMGCIPPKDHDMKHHVFHALVKKPVNEFNSCMKEIITETKEAKKLVSEIITEVKLKQLEEAIDEEIAIKRDEAIQRSVTELDDILNELYDGLGE